MKCDSRRWTSKVINLFLLNLFVLSLGLGNAWAGGGVAPKVSLLGVPKITSLAGAGWSNPGYTGDGGAASAGLLSGPYAVAVDSPGNVYIADSGNFVIRAVNTQPVAITVAGITIQPGNIATIAGTGAEGSSGDGGAATSAQLGWVEGIILDGGGNIYIVDESNNYVRKISNSGIITAFAGSSSGFCNGGSGNAPNGDGGAATSAIFQCIYGISADLAGNIYISDINAGLIRKVDTQGIINTVAGNSQTNTWCGETSASGDGGPATSAIIACAVSVSTDQNGNLYISDYTGQTVRVVNTQNTAITVAGVTIQAGNIDRIAGDGTNGYGGDGGPATSAQLGYPWGVTLDALGNVYISAYQTNDIRRVDTNGIITTYAGTAYAYDYSGDGGPATSAALYYPSGLAVDRLGNLYIADAQNNAIRKVGANGGGSTVDFGSVALGSNTTQLVRLYINEAVTINNVQANGDFVVGAPEPAVRSSSQRAVPTPTIPKGMPAVSAKLLKRAIAQRVLQLTPQTPGPISCIGTFAQGDVCSLFVRFAPGKPGSRWFQLTATDSDQNNYKFGLTGTGAGSLVSITPGIIHTPQGGAGIGAATGIVRDSAGNTYVADYASSVVSKIDALGGVSVVAGIRAESAYDGDGGLATGAHLNDPLGLSVDSTGNLYIADVLNNVIRKVDTNGFITTVAGNGTAGYSGDGSLATNAQLDNPLGVLVDKLGNVYIADTYNNVVRKVDLNGNISTVAGAGTGAGTGSWQDGSGNGDPSGGSGGDGGRATDALLNGPAALALDENGNLYVADTWNSSIRKVDSGQMISHVAGVCGEGCEFGYSGDGGPATSAELSNPFGLALDAAGDLYLADIGNGAIRKIDVNGVITTVAGGNDRQNVNINRTDWRAQVKAQKARPHSPVDIGDGGLATRASIFPVGVAVDNNGSFYLSDVAFGSVRMVDVTTSDMNFGSINHGFASDPQTVTVSNAGNAALNFTQLSIATGFGWGGDGLCNTAVSLSSGNSCPLVADFTPPTGGDYSGSIVLTDDAFNSPHTVTLEGHGTEPDYGITADPSTLSLHQGQTGTVALTVTPENGYNGTVQFACTGLPAYSSCSFSPTAASFDGNTDPLSVTLTVTTTGPAAHVAVASGARQTPGSPLNPWFMSTTLVGVALLAGTGSRQKRKHLMALRMISSFALLAGAMVLNGCGTGPTQPAQPPPPPPHVTPVGSYSATVTTTASASGSGGQHQTAITITIVP